MKDLEKELEDKQGKRMPIMVGIIALLFLISIFVTSALLTSAPEPPKQAYLLVDDVFFVLSEPEGGLSADMVTIDVTAFITNRGTLDAKNVEITAFSIDKNTNLAMDKTIFVVGSIQKDKTRGSEFSLTMPNNDSYIIKLIILEDGKISVKGSGTVELEGDSGSKGSGFKTDPKDNGGRGEDYALGGLSASESSLGIFLVTGAIMVIIILVVLWVSSLSKKSPSPPRMNYRHGQNINKPPLSRVPNVTEAILVQSDNRAGSKADESQIIGHRGQASSEDTEQVKEMGESP